jgi:hypothetical protein
MKHNIDKKQCKNYNTEPIKYFGSTYTWDELSNLCNKKKKNPVRKKFVEWKWRKSEATKHVFISHFEKISYKRKDVRKKMKVSYQLLTKREERRIFEER